MVRVPEYQSNVTLRPDLRQDIEVRATPEAFGADIGRGMQGLAKGIDNAGDAFAQVRQLEDALLTKGADNNYAAKKRELEYGENGFFTKQGQAAVEARPEYERKLEELRKASGQGLTPGAAKMYEQASQARVASSLDAAMRHTAQERKRWFGEAGSARLNTFSEDALAGFSNPAVVEKNIAAGQAELRQQGAMLGWDGDTLKNREKEYISEVRFNVAARFMSTDAVAAKKYYETHKDQFTGPHQFKFEEAVKVPLLNETVKRNTGAFFESPAAAGAVNMSIGTPGGRPGDAAAATVIRKFEGFREKPYWDVNAHRVGYGSDTITRADGGVVRVTPGMEVTREDAERDLSRRISTEFVPGIIKMVGQESWSKLPSTAQAALASVAYNYGKLPANVAAAVQGGDLAEIATQVQALKGHNDGVNAGRRSQEAAIIAGVSGLPASRAGSVPGFANVESYLAKIKDPTERDLTRKSIYAQIETQNRAAKAEKEAYQTQAFNLIETKNISPFNLPPEITTAIGMEGMSSLMNYWEKRSAGEKIRTDAVTFSDMQTLYATNPQEYAKINLFEYKNKLSDEDWKQANNWRQTALTDQRKAREDGLTLTTAFSQAATQLEAVGISTVGKDGTKREEAAKRIAQFQNALAGELEAFKKANNKNPNQIEIQAMTNKLLLPIVIKQPGMLWGTNAETGKRLFEAGGRPDGATVDVDVKYGDIPIDLRRGIATDLQRELGRKPSEEEIVNRYEEVALAR